MTPAAQRTAFDRPRYRAALQTQQAGNGSEAFDTLLYERLDATLRKFLNALAEARPLRRHTTASPDRPGPAKRLVHHQPTLRALNTITVPHMGAKSCLGAYGTVMTPGIIALGNEVVLRST